MLDATEPNMSVIRPRPTRQTADIDPCLEDNMDFDANSQGGPLSELGVRVSGDSSHLWSYAGFGSALALVVGCACTAFELVSGDVFDHSMIPVVIVGLPAFAGGAFALRCLIWRELVLPTAYLVSADWFVVFDGAQEVARYAKSDIVDIELVGVMDYRRMLTNFRYYNRKWPHGRIVLVRDEGARRKVVNLPQIMIWGAEQVRAQEAALKRAVGLGQ